MLALRSASMDGDMTHDEAKARGGYARAEVLGPDERRAIAR
jgi:hypothetical protein